MRGLIILGCCVLAGCSDSSVKDAVRDSLLDPESARFGPISYSKSGELACAEVNAKNRMGGYTGDKQIYLKKIDGEWTPFSDSEESHESCVESIKELENEGDGNSVTVNI